MKERNKKIAIIKKHVEALESKMSKLRALSTYRDKYKEYKKAYLALKRLYN